VGLQGSRPDSRNVGA